MRRMDLLYTLDSLLEQCKTCEKKPRSNENANEKCKDCQVYSQIRWIGENLGRKKEMPKKIPETLDRCQLTKELYNSYKKDGNSDKLIAQKFGITQPTLIKYKKKWSTAQKEPITAEKKPFEGKTTKEVKNTEYERLIGELRFELKIRENSLEKYRHLTESLKSKITEYENIIPNSENNLANAQEEKERLLDENNLLINENRKLDTIIENQKYQLGQYAKENGELQEENEKLKYFALKYLAV